MMRSGVFSTFSKPSFASVRVSASSRMTSSSLSIQSMWEGDRNFLPLCPSMALAMPVICEALNPWGESSWYNQNSTFPPCTRQEMDKPLEVAQARRFSIVRESSRH